MMPQMARWVHSWASWELSVGCCWGHIEGLCHSLLQLVALWWYHTVFLSFYGDRKRHFNVCIIQSAALPGNSNICAIKLYRYVWFAFQLSPKGAAIWINCFVAILTIIALWPVAIMFQQVRVLLNRKKIIPKFALYQVRNSVFPIRIDLTVDIAPPIQVFNPLLKDYSIFFPLNALCNGIFLPD